MPLISLNIISPILHLPLKDCKMNTLDTYICSVCSILCIQKQRKRHLHSKNGYSDILEELFTISSCALFNTTCFWMNLFYSILMWFTAMKLGLCTRVPTAFSFLLLSYLLFVKMQRKFLKSFIRPVFMNHLNKWILKHSLCSSLNFFWMISGTADWYIIFLMQ